MLHAYYFKPNSHSLVNTKQTNFGQLKNRIRVYLVLGLGIQIDTFSAGSNYGLIIVYSGAASEPLVGAAG